MITVFILIPIRRGIKYDFIDQVDYKDYQYNAGYYHFYLAQIYNALIAIENSITWCIYTVKM